MKKFPLFIITLILLPGCSKKETTPEPLPVPDQFLAHFSATTYFIEIFGQTPAGIRADFYFEGLITGDSINGFMSGIDYYLERADGVGEINAHAPITTNDSALITVYITGYVYDGYTIQDEIVSFESGYKKYS
ncbi:MAG: hypothetical protein ABIJ04_12595 [Bacteroidota bacterium]